MELKVINECIYCGATSYDASNPGLKLGDEHIVPTAIGGTLILKKASCRLCERRVLAFERPVLTSFFAAQRVLLGLRGRKRKQGKPHLSGFKADLIFADGGRETVDVTPDEYPISYAFPIMDFPHILPIRRETAEREIVIKFLRGDPEKELSKLEALAARMGAIRAELSWPVEYDNFRLMLAKIAHGIARYRLSKTDFEPLLPSLIMGKTSRLRDLVGCIHRAPEHGKDSPTHVVQLESADFENIDGRGPTRLLMVRISLFAKLNAPDYLVVTGVIPRDLDLGPCLFVPRML